MISDFIYYTMQFRFHDNYIVVLAHKIFPNEKNHQTTWRHLAFAIDFENYARFDGTWKNDNFVSTVPVGGLFPKLTAPKVWWTFMDERHLLDTFETNKIG